jgi:hypothetical protein
LDAGLAEVRRAVDAAATAAAVSPEPADGPGTEMDEYLERPGARPEPPAWIEGQTVADRSLRAMRPRSSLMACCPVGRAGGQAPDPAVAHAVPVLAGFLGRCADTWLPADPSRLARFQRMPARALGPDGSEILARASADAALSWNKCQ